MSWNISTLHFLITGIECMLVNEYHQIADLIGLKFYIGAR